MSVQAISWAIDHSPHGGSELLLLIMIANHAHADGTGAFPSVETLAKECRMSVRQVQRLIKQLEKAKAITVKRSQGWSTHTYAVIMNHDKMSGSENPVILSGSKAENHDILSENHDITVSPYPSEEKTKTLPTVETPTATSSKAKKAVDEKPSKAKTKTPPPPVAVLALRPLLDGLPHKTQWPNIVAALGDNPDIERLTECLTVWAGHGFVVYNLNWIYDWYVNGIPERMRTNGNQPKQQTLIDGFIDMAPPPDFADSMQIQKYFFDSGGEGAELYQDRPTYEEFKAGWLPVFEKRSAEYFQMAQEQIREYEESEIFKRRFNGEL